MSRSLAVIAGSLIAVVGLGLLAVGVMPRAGLDAPIATPSASGVAGPAATAAGVAPTSAATPNVGPLSDGYRIQVPRLAIDLPLAEGDVYRDVVTHRTPENFAFHLPGTAIPGVGSNSYIYAHARRGMFLTLWNASVGDEVVISTPAGTMLRYVISEIHPRVHPEDTSWIQPTRGERLTLQTSTGPNPEDPRFIVIATPS